MSNSTNHELKEKWNEKWAKRMNRQCIYQYTQSALKKFNCKSAMSHSLVWSIMSNVTKYCKQRGRDGKTLLKAM